MGIAQWMVDYFVTDKVAHLAERIAGRSRLATYQRVCEKLHTLDVHEARGYIRARAAQVVSQETDKIIAQEGANLQRLRSQLIAASMDSLVTALLQQMEQTRRARPAARRLAA